VSLPEQVRGKFIVLDGPDGCGKSTQIRLLERRLQEQAVPVVRTRDPGGTAASEAIRQMLLSGQYGQLSTTCELLLFMASRAQLIYEVIGAALGEGKTVLCDRFVSASCAYQGASGADVRDILGLGDFTVGPYWPDLTIVIDVPVEVGLSRLGELFVGQALDAMESRPLEFHQRVREMFLKLPQLYPKPVAIVDGRPEPDIVHQSVIQAIEQSPLGGEE